MIERTEGTESAARFSSATSEAPPQAADATLPWVALPGGVVDGGEIVLLAIKPSMWRPLLDSASWLVTSCFLAVALVWLGAPLPGLSLTMTAQLALLIGAGRLGVAIVRWIPAWYVLTNRRIIDIHGVRAPKAASSLLVDIRNTYVRYSPSEKLLGLGSILCVSSRDGDRPRLWRVIDEPEEIHARIRRAIEHAIDQQGTG